MAGPGNSNRRMNPKKRGKHFPAAGVEVDVTSPFHRLSPH